VLPGLSSIFILRHLVEALLLTLCEVGANLATPVIRPWSHAFIIGSALLQRESARRPGFGRTWIRTTDRFLIRAGGSLPHPRSRCSAYQLVRVRRGVQAGSVKAASAGCDRAFRQSRSLAVSALPTVLRTLLASHVQSSTRQPGSRGSTLIRGSDSEGSPPSYSSGLPAVLWCDYRREPMSG